VRTQRPVSSKAQRKRDRIITLQAYSLFAPNLILFMALGLYPIVWAIRFVFYRYNGRFNQVPVFVGWENFVRVFTRDPYYWQSVANTFVYAGGKLVLTLPLAFLIAVVLNKPKKINRVFQSVIFMPTITSSAVMGLIFYLILNVYNGELNKYLLGLHLIKDPISWLAETNAMKTAIVVAVWGALGNYMVYFLAGLQMIPAELYESALIDGANRRQTLFSITIPMLTPILKIILMLAIGGAFGDYTSIMVLTGGGPLNSTMVMSLYSYQLFFPISVETTMNTPAMGYGAAVSVVSGLIAGACTGIYLWIGRKMDKIF
jgi:ABC-type sugar transport system permease subunit